MSLSYLAFAGLYLACFVLAITVCGIYAADLPRSLNNSKWIYAVTVGALSAVTCVVFVVPVVMRAANMFAAVWNFILSCLWLAVFGIFGRMYMHVPSGGNGNLRRMRNAVWVDLVSGALWLVASIVAFARWSKTREPPSKRTGRVAIETISTANTGTRGSSTKPKKTHAKEKWEIHMTGTSDVAPWK